MKQWYSFYSVNTEARAFISNIEEQININGSKLKQVGGKLSPTENDNTILKILFKLE